MSESDPLHRPATAEEIEMVERLLKRARPADNVVPLPKARPVPKSSTENVGDGGNAAAVSDTAKAAVLLASDRARFLTGTVANFTAGAALD